MNDDDRDLPHALARNWGWLLALGLVLMVGGLAAIASPFVASLFISTWIGIVFAAAGVAQLIQALRARGWRGSVLHVVSGLVYLLGGALVVFRPLAGLIALSIIVVATFIAGGIVRVYSGLTLRPEKGWGWITAGGAVAIVAGLVIWATYPQSALTLLGLLAGVAFLMEGWSVVFLALGARAAARRLDA